MAGDETMETGAMDLDRMIRGHAAPSERHRGAGDGSKVALGGLGCCLVCPDVACAEPLARSQGCCGKPTGAVNEIRRTPHTAWLRVAVG
ncbi:MAG: hypothetical protein IPO88_30010 [Nannocystis sp.]|nr:hypothetical protein [Nannocystis sp.]